MHKWAKEPWCWENKSPLLKNKLHSTHANGQKIQDIGKGKQLSLSPKKSKKINDAVTVLLRVIIPYTKDAAKNTYTSCINKLGIKAKNTRELTIFS